MPLRHALAALSTDPLVAYANLADPLMTEILEANEPYMRLEFQEN